MLPKKHRLSKSAEVKQTTARGRSFFNPYFVVKFLKGSDNIQITVIVSTKVSKKAVTRNLLKRVVRSVVKDYLTKFYPGDYAFIIKPAAVKITTLELRKQLTAAIISNKLLKL